MKAAKSFIAVGAFNVFTTDVTFSRSDEVSEGVQAVRVSSNLLSVLGISPLAGRSFTAAEETGGSCVALISETLAARIFPNNSAALGDAVRIGGMPCVIAGILPRGFEFPFPDVDVWMPLQPGSMTLQARIHSPTLAIVARLKSGVSLRQASEEIKLVNQQYALANPGALDAKPGRPENLVLLKDQLVRDVRPALWMLMGAVALVLSIACANIAGLLLVRARSRSREFAVRMALGAGIGRLTKQLVAESVILSLSGGSLGIAAASLAVRRVERIPGLQLPRVAEIQLDWTVVAFATLLSIGTGVAFGAAPFRLSLRGSLMDVLRGGDDIPEPRRAFAFVRFATGSRNVLVILQVALSTVLLIGAVLLIVSVARLRNVNPGFDAHNWRRISSK
jgi:predicted permease